MDNPLNNSEIQNKIIIAQKNEITEYHIYLNLAAAVKDKNNKEVLDKIANEELAHAHFWQKYSGIEVKPNRWKIFKYTWISRILGLTFGIKLMEKGETIAEAHYLEISQLIPEAKKIADDEDRHENALIEMIREEKLEYIGSVVLGLNDALVELTGSLAGFSLALQNTKIIAMAGLISGIAAGLSMAASEYLSTKTSEAHDKALRSSIYTGIAYLITVIFLILPYLLFTYYLVCLAVTLVIALLIILIFNYYLSVAKDYNFKKRFFEMAAISMGVAALTFCISWLIKTLLHVNI
jgi:VIT1/CCC1 family predicted Fe2+/Mn2+ transporter